MATLAAAAPGVPVSFGSLVTAQEGGTLRLTFHATVDGRGRDVTLLGREVTLADDTLMLPITFGRDSLVPRRITINYRDGKVATVRYQGSSSGGTTFQVVRRESEDLAAQSGTASEFTTAESRIMDDGATVKNQPGKSLTIPTRRPYREPGVVS